MSFSGLTDLPEREAQDYTPCRCGSLARVASGVCVTCLLRSGLESSEAETEDFDALLDSINIPDRDWQLGNYRILEEIGRGGMGVIYRARHGPSRRIVALKRVLNYHSDSHETLSRFQREATAAASLDHPNILPIYDVGATDDGLPFFSMKFAAGGSLLESRRRFRDSPRRAVELMAAVTRAVDYAHRQGILHRDLKPGNILLDARGEPMVSDFGLAKWLDTTSELTRTLTVFGTPGYIAPEQGENAIARLTPTADVYSLGAILFEVLSGRPPFLGEHAVAVIRQAAENDAPKLRSIVPNIPRDLETICARCLERDPNLRYQSAAELSADLKRWLEGRPIKARPISPVGRLYRWSRRNPIVATSVAICLFFGAAVIARHIQTWKLENKLRENEFSHNSVAVLPFLDLDRATEDSDWTAVLVQTLQAELSGIGAARVVHVAQGDDVKTVARNFRTRTALSGSLRKNKGGVRVSMRLLSPDGDVLLSRVVDLKGESSDAKQLTHGIAPAIYAVLNAKDWMELIAAGRDPALRNKEAHELLTAGRELHFHYTVRDFDRAISCFEKVISLEPASALAHAYLASSAASRTHLVSDPSFLNRAELEAREALRLRPTLADVHRVLAGVLYQRGRFRDALEEQMRAIELGGPEENVVGFIGMTLDMLGQPDRALPWYEMARQLATRPGHWDSLIGDCWSRLCDDRQAEIAYRRAIDLQSDMPRGWIGICRLRLLQGNIEGARTLCRENRKHYSEYVYSDEIAAVIEFFGRNFVEAERLYDKLARADANGGAAFYGDISYNSALGHIRLAKGNSSRVRALLEECLDKDFNQLESAPDNPEVLYRVSAIESTLGRKESSLSHLKEAVKAGWIDYRSLSLDPRFDAVADDARFKIILGGLKLKVDELRRSTGTVSIPNQLAAKETNL
jgi:serine/threonine protein kinase/tetratricopeptide (TPR) repeat protein